MNKNNLTKEEELKFEDFLEKKLPLLNEFDEKIDSVEDFYLNQFELLEEEIKERIINDETIPLEDLEKVYIKELDNAKSELLERVMDKFEDIKKEFVAQVA